MPTDTRDPRSTGTLSPEDATDRHTDSPPHSTTHTSTSTSIGDDPATHRVRENLRNEGDFDVIFHADRNGNPLEDLTPRQIAEAIRDNPAYTPGTPVRLVACNAANNPDLAQQLADELGASVHAPTEAVGVPNRPDSPAHVRDGGAWVTYHPTDSDGDAPEPARTEAPTGPVEHEPSDIDYMGDDRPEEGSVDPPRGIPLDPQPTWHGQTAGRMRHFRGEALDVSGLSPEEQIEVLRREAEALANEAINAPHGGTEHIPPGRNRRDSGCAGSFVHNDVMTTHTSTTKMHGQKAPETHPVIRDMLQQVADAAEGKVGLGHGKCAEISLISDRLHQVDPSGTQLSTIPEARAVLEGGVMHTRQIGDLASRDEESARHGDFLPPCRTCAQILPQLGIKVATPEGGGS
ncbi:YwqJ-related putative deaminase [Nocardia takedensis]|uniref:YwqJ-related putative deaminase n=1 Tax=Nocardia takedensis TaxID=259390 RepID=UPI000685440D|nr:YwqJ-related putative deaminase [Nocardia takedensis]